MFLRLLTWTLFLEVDPDLQGGDDQPEVLCHRLLEGQQLHAPPLYPQVQVVDPLIVSYDLPRLLHVVIAEGIHGVGYREADQIHQLYRSRLPFYHEADIRLRVGDATPNRIAREVLRVLREDWSIVAERRRLFP